MRMLVVRLAPGDDLKAALAAIPAREHVDAACVVSAVGSLNLAVLRYAGRADAVTLARDLELVTLSGTLAPDGVHLHASVADDSGAVRGGHVQAGCRVRTTAEIVIGLLDGWAFSRAVDPRTGFRELVASARAR
jgi:predicted DNA-binding protein with PD1-like motif